MSIRPLPASITAGLVAVLAGAPLAAQIDYRNLDAGRPVRTEDAYAVERFAFELVIPYAYHDEAGGHRVHLVAPELSYGALPNFQVGVMAPLAVQQGGGATDWGSAGLRLFALYNLNTEAPLLPALAMRTDLSLPVGALGGDAVRGSVTAIATRSWGRTRAHLNASVGLGRDAALAAAEPIADWAAGLAVDRSFLRQSFLVIGEVVTERAVGGAPTAVTAGFGGRWQITPTLVLDAGLHRRLTGDAGPDLGLTLGLSHVFALAGLMPVRGR